MTPSAPSRPVRRGSSGARKLAAQALWAVLASFFVAYAQLFVALGLHGVGGECHAIFAYSSGGRPDVARRVFLEYVGSVSVAAAALILLRYPGHWLVTTLLAAAIAWCRWRQIVWFPLQSTELHELSRWRMLWVFPVVVTAGALACALRRHLDERGDPG